MEDHRLRSVHPHPRTDALAAALSSRRPMMSEDTPWQRAAQAAESFSLSTGPLARQAMMMSGLWSSLPAPLAVLTQLDGSDWGRIAAAHASTAYMLEPTVASRTFQGAFPWSIVWLRRPKSKKRRQWKKWQRLHAEQYLRMVHGPLLDRSSALD